MFHDTGDQLVILLQELLDYLLSNFNLISQPVQYKHHWHLQKPDWQPASAPANQQASAAAAAAVASVVSNAVQPHWRQPTRLLCSWDSPGKNTGVGWNFLFQCMKVKSGSEVTQSCPTLSDPLDCSLPGSSVHGIFQARVGCHCLLLVSAMIIDKKLHLCCYWELPLKSTLFIYNCKHYRRKLLTPCGGSFPNLTPIC